VSLATYTRVWRKARTVALTRPNSDPPWRECRTSWGTPPCRCGSTPECPATQVAEWAGHSVHVLLKVYAKCIDGQDEAARRRIEAALRTDAGTAGA
jgi:hypothetical protein